MLVRTGLNTKSWLKIKSILNQKTKSPGEQLSRTLLFIEYCDLINVHDILLLSFD